MIQGHTSNFKDNGSKKVKFWGVITATPVWIHRWLFECCTKLVAGRGALLFSKVIQISRSGTKQPILTQIGRFRTIGRSQLSNPSDLPCYLIPPHWHDTGSWNPSSCKTRTYLFYIVNIMAADDLSTQGARASATMILTMLHHIHWVPTR